MEFKRRDIRVMIYYDFKSSLTPEQCKERLQNAIGDQAPHISTIYRWYAEFNRGRFSLGDEPREGRPSTAVTEENVNAVRRMVGENNRITYEEIRASLNIGMSQIQKILRERLCVKKICCRWIPHSLTQEQKNIRVDWCKKMIAKFRGGASNSVYDIVTGDETWIYSYEPESKAQSTQWIFPDEPNPTKVKRSRSVGKKMIASFFRRSGHIITLSLEESRTVNAEWYTTVCLPTVINKIRETRPKKKIILHHDNAPAHTSTITEEFLTALGVEKMTHPPYSPDLAPCDFFLFPKIKNKMRGRSFKTPEEAVEEFKNCVSEIPLEDWIHCFNDWFNRMQKCIDCKGEYFEKQ